MACDVAMLDHGEPMLDILNELTFTRMTTLADTAPARRNRLPLSTVGLVFGAVRRQEHVLRLRALRQRVEILLAVGTCAVTGGAPALAFLPGSRLADDLASRVPTVPGPPSLPGPRLDHADPLDPHGASENPGEEDLLPHCLPVSHYVRVDMEVPGCPPHPDWIAECLLAMLDARTPHLPQRSVCHYCPARRSGGLPLDDTLFRMLDTPEAPPHESLADLPCLLEQGFLCMGPITRGGCGGKGQAPRCVHAYAPCRGCHGPAHNRPQPLADMVCTLTAAGYDIRTLPDIPGYLSRYSGVHWLNLYKEES